MSAHRNIYKLITSAIRKDLRVRNIRPMGRDVWITLETPEQASRVIDFLVKRKFTKARRSTDPMVSYSSAPESPMYFDAPPGRPRGSPHMPPTEKGDQFRYRSYAEDRERSSPLTSSSDYPNRSTDSRKRLPSFSDELQRGDSETDQTSKQAHREERPHGRPTANAGHPQRKFEAPREAKQAASDVPTHAEDNIDDIENQLLMNNHFFDIAMIGKKSMRDMPRQISVTHWGEYRCTDTLLYKVFSSFGAIWSVQVASPTKGVVTFVHPGSTHAALHSATIDGLFVNENRLHVSIVSHHDHH